MAYNNPLLERFLRRSMVVLLTLHANCSCFAPKPAHPSSKLPDGEQGVFSESQPLWGIILGNGFWHLLEHFTQFYLERNEVLRATQLQQAWVGKVMQLDVPGNIKSIGLYTLALFSALTKQEASAKVALRQAKTFNPDPAIESIILYTLASFYVTTNQKAKAEATLRQALALNPELVEFSKQDSDMMALLGE